MSMMHAFKEELGALPRDTTTLRKFGLTVGGVFLAIAAFLFWREVSWAPILLWIGLPLVLLGAVIPRVLGPIYTGWMGLAIVLGAIVTRILLTIFFFLVITPVALFFKLIGRDALHRKLDPQAATYWIDKDYPIADRSRFEKFF